VQAVAEEQQVGQQGLVCPTQPHLFSLVGVLDLNAAEKRNSQRPQSNLLFT
jgi:hypothetical protein